MIFDIDKIKERLRNSVKEDIEFLKKEWREWIKNKEFEKFEILKGANIQVVYDILKIEKIKSISQPKNSPDPDRIKVVIHHSYNFEVEVIIKLDEPSIGKIGVITYIKKQIRKR